MQLLVVFAPLELIPPRSNHLLAKLVVLGLIRHHWEDNLVPLVQLEVTVRQVLLVALPLQLVPMFHQVE